MPSKRKNKINIWVGGFVGFLLGVGGNLLATWIQQDLLKNSFTPLRIGLITHLTQR
jgi:cadmium resistance protein CadD (predicted permease)